MDYYPRRRRAMRRSVFSVTAALALFIAGVSEAQTDPVKALVGKWQGEAQNVGRGNPDRTLIIETVSEKDGKWLAEGRFGITGQRFGPVQIQVEMGGQWLAIRFVTGANSTVRLNMVDDKSMVGTLTFVGASNSGQSNDRAMRLQRME
jgi:hypothetical protein